MSALSQQAVAVETALRIIGGGAQRPSAREKDLIVAGLKAASVTLRNLEYERGARQ